MRYVRAFFKALVLTARGETIDAPVVQSPYPKLDAWLDEARAQVEAVYRAAKDAAYDESARKAHTITIDGRATSAETIIAGVRYHLNEEYPYMLQNPTPHTLTGIYATNVNDQFAVSKLAEDERLPTEVEKSMRALVHHLGSIPPSNDL